MTRIQTETSVRSELYLILGGGLGALFPLICMLTEHKQERGATAPPSLRLHSSLLSSLQARSDCIETKSERSRVPSAPGGTTM